MSKKKSNKKVNNNKDKNVNKQTKQVEKSSFYQDIDTLTPEQLKEEKKLSFIVRNIYGFIIVIVLLGLTIPFYIEQQKEKDKEILTELGYEQMLVELRLINLLSTVGGSLDESKLDEVKQIAKDMDKEYREISFLHEDEKDYYGYFVGTINSYTQIIDEYLTNTNESSSNLLEEADALLYEFYAYKSEVIHDLDLPEIKEKDEVKQKITKNIEATESEENEDVGEDTTEPEKIEEISDTKTKK